ncbi:hypothetical protein [Sphingobium chungbukense]|uniref:PPE-repeat protein n=1 Tax=Sphingobium chungbukense TaxID=56193 RepID=A0A0M3AS16_9SPHN|nr:hypothetical protein [Sphingobium chungbukense]KKW91319.1 hypothetical protein YP76_17320 [Sphingobium chungbukense]
MIYKAFAAITLIAAPIIVLTVQSFVPGQPAASAPMGAAPAASIAPVAAPVQPGPPPPPAVSDAGTASFGQPMPDAGKPFLAPGAGLPAAGLPAASATEAAPGENAEQQVGAPQ